MGFKCGIVGLPNVGKSTLFNALTETIAAESANYPFCTIEPNLGRVSVPDERLLKLAKIANSAAIIPTCIDIVDIAGLVKGASKGEGLGNKFLANIREVDAIIHVVRCFDDPNVTHVEDTIDPVRDIELIETELIIADHESLERRLTALKSKNKQTKEKEVLDEMDLMEKVLNLLSCGKAAKDILKTSTEYTYDDLRKLQVITSKPVLYVCNVAESDISNGNSYSDKVKAFAATRGDHAITVSARIEEEIAQFSDQEEKEFFLESLGLKESGLSQLIRYGYKILNLITYFTIGPKEARAWSIKDGLLAPQAAGVIHTDFERGFIRAEVIHYDDYIKYNGEQGAKENGKLGSEGKEYRVQDGDVIHFRFNV